jgi:transcriptional regulator GlxA family with amidase domain
MKASILVYNGVEELDVIGPYRVLQHAARLGADLELALVTLEPRRQVTAEGGLRILPDRVLDVAPNLLVVPGGGWLSRAPRGLHAQIADGNLPRRVREVHSAGTTVAGVNTGTMALCAAGLLDGRPATTHRGAVEELKMSGALSVESRVVVASDVLTCAGAGASVDLSLWVVEQHWGRGMADSIANEMGHIRSADVYVACEATAAL